MVAKGSNTDSTKSVKIRTYDGGVSDFQLFIDSVRNYATQNGTIMEAVFDANDDPTIRTRREEDAEVPKTDREKRCHFNDHTSETKTLKAESMNQYKKYKDDWITNAKKLFSAIKNACKGEARSALQNVNENDVQGAIAELTKKWGEESDTGRANLLFDFLEVSIDDFKTTEAYLTTYQEYRQKLGKLNPPEVISNTLANCVFLKGVKDNDDAKSFVANFLANHKLGETSPDTMVDKAREYFKTTTFMKTTSSAFRSKGKAGKHASHARGSGSRGKDRPCWNCGEVGHDFKHCDKPETEQLRAKLQEIDNYKAEQVIDRINRRKKKQREERAAAASKSKSTKKIKFNVSVARSRAASAKFLAAKQRAAEKGVEYALLDTGANSHCVNTRLLLGKLQDARGHVVVTADGHETPVDAKSKLHGIFENSNHSKKADPYNIEGTMGNALYTRGFEQTLIAAMPIVKAGGVVHLEQGNCYFTPNENRDVKIKVRIEGDDFVVRVKPDLNLDPSESNDKLQTYAAAAKASTPTSELTDDTEKVESSHDDQSTSEIDEARFNNTSDDSE